MDRLPDLTPHHTGVFGRDPSDQYLVFTFQQLERNSEDLLGRLARSENDLGKTLAQGSMEVHLSKAQVRHRCRLEGAQHLIPAQSAGPEFLE